MKNPLILILLALGLTACAPSQPAADCAELDVSEAWIREMPPGPQVTAGYLVLNNNDNQAITVDRFSSPAFARVELHESIQTDGMMQMRKMDALHIPGTEGLALQPGGWHLMLFEPKQTLKAGQTLPLTLHCGKDSVTTTAEVRKGGASQHEFHDHQHQHHGNH